MKDNTAYRFLKKQFDKKDGWYLYETRYQSARKDAYLKTKAGAQWRRRIDTLLTENETVSTELFLALIQKENKKLPFTEKQLASLDHAITLCALDFVAREKDRQRREQRFFHAQKILRLPEKIDFQMLYEKLSVLHGALMASNVYKYRDLDNLSRTAIRQEVLRYAKKHRVSEAEGARLYAKEKPKPRIHERKRAAFWLFFLLFFLLMTLVFFFCPLFAAVLLTLPMAALALTLTQNILASLLSPIPILSLRPAPVPESAATLVVITSLLSGDDDALFSKLDRYYHRNKDNNIYFGVLADLPESRHMTNEQDEKILKKATENLARLQQNYGDHFCLFVRRRTLCTTEGSYLGWERKRGALLSLCRAARGKSHDFSYLSHKASFLSRFRYIITLDSDTELSMGMARELVYTMLHPQNKPIVKKGIVVSGYGVLQPKMIPSLSSASATPFSVLQTGSGGRDNYTSFAPDFDQNVLGQGSFCGKGIFDIDAFLATLDGAFPDEKILSHDLLEGTRLGCGALCSKVFIDTVPSGPISFYKRQHRWMRGDVQSLPFALSHHKNAAGEKVKNPISTTCRFQIWRNLLFLLRPIFSFAALVSTLFLPIKIALWVFTFSTLHITLPFVWNMMSNVCHPTRRFYSTVIQGIWHGLSDMLFSLATLAENALLHLDALIKSLFRMTLSHRHLLQWVTAEHAERGSKRGLWAHLVFFWKSIAAGGLFLFFAPHGLIYLYGILTLSFPVIAYFTCRPFAEKKEVSPKQKQVLYSYAQDAISFYDTFVTEKDNYLPPDNYQFSPTPALAHRTSPTNIAMYLLSVLASRDLDLISSEELYIRLRNTLESVLSLAKYRGHLYNWYDTQTKEVIGEPYISTVDSGNFIVSLATLKYGIADYQSEEPRLAELVPLCEKLINDCDFTFLYNQSRHLFCIGYDTIKQTLSENCYDLFMSECRTISYYLVAKGVVDKRHWQALGRPLVKSEGYMGMASWSGTGFEFFMPTLFLPTPKNSLSYECLGFALYEQAHDDSHGLWGRSESGYYAFDEKLNYQYRAFGSAGIGLDNSHTQDDVLAPYASFLMLPLSISMPLSNLEKMKEIGMYGPHGFYEAIDFTPSRVGKGHGIVASYMAHHVGMTILALTNALKDNIFVKRFLRDSDLSAACELLEERIPVDAPITRTPTRREVPLSLHKRVLLPEDFGNRHPDKLPACAALFGKELSVLASEAGYVCLMAGKTALTYPLFDASMKQKGLRLLVNTDKGILDVLDAGKFGRYRDALVYAGKQKEISYRVAFTASGDSPFVSICLDMEGDFCRAEPMLLSEVILNQIEHWLGHPCYSGLFIECHYRPEENALLFCRRPKKEEEQPLWMIVTMEGGGFDFLCRRDEAFLPMYGEEDIRGLFSRLFDSKDGQCVFPFFALRRPSECERGKFKAEFLIGMHTDCHALLQKLHHLRKNKNPTIGAALAVSYKQLLRNRMLAAGYDENQIGYERYILTSLLYNTIDKPQKTVCTHPNLFWRHGISTDLPMVALCVSNEQPHDNVKRILIAILRLWRYFHISGFSFDLILFYRDTEKYACPVKNALLDLVTKNVGDGMIGRKGGVFLVSDKETEEAAQYLCPVYLKPDMNTVPEKVFATHFAKFSLSRCDNLICRSQKNTPTPEKTLLPLAYGAFFEGGYRVYKNRCRQVQSRIYCSHQFGTLLTQNSLGVTFFQNAGEFSLTKRRPDPLLDLNGERLLITLDNCQIDLCAAAHTVDFTVGYARYEGDYSTLHYELLVGCDAKFPVKLVLLRLENRGDTVLSPKINYKILPDLGRSKAILEKEEDNTRFYRSLDHLRENEQFGIFLSQIHLPKTISPEKSHVCHFLLGVVNYKNDRSYYKIKDRFATEDSVLSAFTGYREMYLPYLSKFHLSSPSPALDVMFNEYIPYQALTSRIFARTGFYQAGGAYGFRDQLQDCMNLLPLDPTLVKRQLLRCAVHQYAEGDVQHWWHQGGKGARGMRTRCSDDLLWMPLALAEYIAHTGDREFLTTRVPYLISQPLGIREDERYETTANSDHRESLLMHCMRAIDLSLSRMGDKGLPLIGSGDWNDGMNLVGNAGKGQSVWLGMFMVLVLEKFATVCLTDNTDKERYLQKAKELREVLLTTCFEKDRFLRAYFDNGSPLGSSHCTECQIDLLPQAFSAFIFPSDSKSKTAMESAKRYLYDENTRTLRLFTPPFDKSEPNPGYIRGYLPGIRENGGQYTHAAMWGAIAFFSLGMKEDGYAVLCGSNPAARCLIPSLSALYRLEPYAIAADIYGAENAGRGGWSQYTGAAGWFYRAVLKGMLGYQKQGDQITLCPQLPEALSHLTLQIREEKQIFSLDCTDGVTKNVQIFLTQNGNYPEKS